MFKKRLLETLKTLGLVLVALGGIVLIAWLVHLIPNAIKEWIYIFFTVLFLTCFFGVILFGICEGIWKWFKWQFIEPYRKSKENQF
jgi:hypothetical protein